MPTSTQTDEGALVTFEAPTRPGHLFTSLPYQGSCGGGGPDRDQHPLPVHGGPDPWDGYTFSPEVA